MLICGYLAVLGMGIASHSNGVMIGASVTFVVLEVIIFAALYMHYKEEEEESFKIDETETVWVISANESHNFSKLPEISQN